MNDWFAHLKCLAWLYYIFFPSYKCQQWWNRWWTNLSDPIALLGSRLILHNSRKILSLWSLLRGGRDLCFSSPLWTFKQPGVEPWLSTAILWGPRSYLILLASHLPGRPAPNERWECTVHLGPLIEDILLMWPSPHSTNIYREPSVTNLVSEG